MSDEELELLAPWNENVKTEIQHRVNNTDQSDVNCQGTPATEKQPGNFLTMAEIYALTTDKNYHINVSEDSSDSELEQKSGHAENEN